MITEPVLERVFVGGVCVYELAAFTTGRFPTLTSICRRHRSVEVAFMLWLVLHLHRSAELEGRFGQHVAGVLNRRTRYGDG